MGVTGLWKLIESAGKQVDLESLEGKIFAVDASILLNQAIKGMKNQPNAHLHVLFLRICKLLTYKIKPIFVFDGAAPILKKQTLIARQKRREEAEENAKDLATRLKRKALQMQALDHVLGKTTVKKPKPVSSEADIFELPPLPDTTLLADDLDNDYFELPVHQLLYSGDLDLSQVDINSDGFKTLPLEYQHEILEELKEYNKRNKSSLSLATAESGDQFSSFQMKKLLKNSKLSNKIETLRKEMITQLADHADNSGSTVLLTNRLLSEDSTHFLLVKKDAASSNSEPHVSFSQADIRSDRLDKDRTEKQRMVTNRTDFDKTTERKLAPQQKGTNLSTIPESSIENTANDQDVVIVADNLKKGSHDRDKGDSEIVIVNKNSIILPSVPAEEPVSIVNEDKAIKSTRSLMESEETALLSSSTLSSKNLEQVVHLTPPSISAIASERLEGREILTPSSSSTVAAEKLVGRRSLTPPSNNAMAAEKLEGRRGLTPPPSSTMAAENSEEMVRLKPPASFPPSHKTNTGFVDHSEDSRILSVTPSSPLGLEISHNSDDNERVKDRVVLELTDFFEQNTDPVYNTITDEEFVFDPTNLTRLSNEIGHTSTLMHSQLKRQEQFSQAVTQHMIDDAIELLRLFGIPYILSVSEAEAQCAKLETLGLCNGTITDDSDIWLFGGSVVLKNFFQHDRFVFLYDKGEVQRQFGLDRNKMIALALVSGSDYTDGIPGAGPITALEIISEFDSQDGVNAVKKFKQWIDAIRLNNGHLPADFQNTAVKAKLKRFMNYVPDSFPNQVVVDAYFEPSVDSSSERFEWDRPDLDLLRDFAKRKLNWPVSKVNDLVCPILKRLNSNETQYKLNKFFQVHTSINTSTEYQSARLKTALSKLVQPTTDFPTSSDSTAKGKSAERVNKTKATKGKSAERVNKTKATKTYVKKSINMQSDSTKQNKRQIKAEINLSESDSE